MDILTAEAKLTGWVGETTGLPELVFRGALPPGVREGFELKLVSGVPAGSDRVNEFTAEVTGISPEKGTLWARFERLFAALPLEKYDTFLYVDIRGVITFSMVEKEGLLLHAGKVELNAAFV